MRAWSPAAARSVSRSSRATSTSISRRLPDGSLGTIFSAQVIEHLPHEQLRRLLELSLRKLAPGGLFIAETVSPHRISSLKTFWVDLDPAAPDLPEVGAGDLIAIARLSVAYVFAPGSKLRAGSLRRAGLAVVATAPDASVETSRALMQVR